MVVDLENNAAIDVVTCEFNPPATAEELDEARSKFNLTPAMIDFYSEANGIKIEWERQGEDDEDEEYDGELIMDTLIYCLSKKYLEIGKVLFISIRGWVMISNLYIR